MIASAGWLHELGRCLHESFAMFWATLWALVLGFMLSGVVQSFASSEGIRRRLGDHRPPSVMRASAYGMASSSCSYAATATARSLFAKGADFVTALVFMFASTNLVIEVGIILLVLLGWQFAAGEFVGGFVMIFLLAAGGSWWLWRGTQLGMVRERLQRSNGENFDVAAEPLTHWTIRARSGAAWRDVARFTISDLMMVRRELLLGYGIAGILAVAVPSRAWNLLFLHGHGFWTSLENAVVGPAIAIASFTCSIGNVPLAASLWKGGIAFGGVISFLFADLITLPLLLIYRRYYGLRLTGRMLLLFWSVMSAAGLLTGYLFEWVGLLPSARAKTLAFSSPSWNATALLNVLSVVSVAVLYVVARKNSSAGAEFQTDPVCGMLVRRQETPASVHHDEALVSFCSDGCRQHFEAHPERYATPAVPTPGG
jgi:uncharacterized membrane protein YraQ (UPF0718 family)/YHS domain-containing protein